MRLHQELQRGRSIAGAEIRAKMTARQAQKGFNGAAPLLERRFPKRSSSGWRIQGFNGAAPLLERR